ncbi:uncharacterized protein Z519_10297 [Cladophialophora bantiana CBS 173.52]|uniref:Cupin type-2 domain-containing protein n=1 Tax=Cladophialophora bantiana (strain ATCC 10958 / CBS 173.52 / CDC B-1940 / NIH 8579) TaxID=1442370 RepID=A0A0D2H661_CLAB1|nr:uncharacterized protein Z519_10297 [Cladophialophora bantiana CBS 173.52]KIW88813.1 hypothetical protein Z519_10297 [Cladophialophora bantiana CBS 173.52]
MTQNNNLPSINRFVTDHDDNGRAIFLNNRQLPEALPFKPLSDGAASFGLGYVTKTFPVELQDRADVKTYQTYLKSAPGLTVSGGTVLRYVDMPPGSLSAMHRTISLDYGIVIEGEVELVLDSGETRCMKRGDVAIQRATKHAWKNASTDSWARLAFILQPSQVLEVGGEKLGEDLHTMQGVRVSD